MMFDDGPRRTRYWLGRRLRALAKWVEPALVPNWDDAMTYFDCPTSFREVKVNTTLPLSPENPYR